MAYLAQLEREWLAKKIAAADVTSQTTNAQMRRRYYAKVVGGAATNVGMDDLERQWLLAEIAARGGTPSGKNRSELWKQLVATISQTPSQYETQNKRIFYAIAS